MTNFTHKPIKESVAFVAENEQGQFLAVQRPDDDDHLPNVWGLPAGSLRSDETAEDTIRRSARDKLGIAVTNITFVGEETADRGDHTLHLREYSVDIPEGEVISITSRDPEVSLYQAFTFSDDPTLLQEAAQKGSLCSIIFLKNKGLWPTKTNV